MKLYKGILFGSFLGLLSCGETREIEVKPEWLIPKETMENILRDIQYAEDATNTLNVSYKDERATLKKFYEQIFKIHDVDAEYFDSSFTYYISHPAELNSIYDSVLVKMQTDEIKVKEHFKKK